MPVEIERKFLVKEPQDWRALATNVTTVKQGYLTQTPNLSVRVRIAEGYTGKKAWMGVKGPTKGFSRDEYEYEIPVWDADELIRNHSLSFIEKTRYHLVGDWVIDVFSGENQGLIVAEVELDYVDQQPIYTPTWIGQEVTSDNKYYNLNLSQHPYSKWDSVSK